jgi:hypothetical protein
MGTVLYNPCCHPYYSVPVYREERKNGRRYQVVDHYREEGPFLCVHPDAAKGCPENSWFGYPLKSIRRKKES